MKIIETKATKSLFYCHKYSLTIMQAVIIKSDNPNILLSLSPLLFIYNITMEFKTIVIS